MSKERPILFSAPMVRAILEGRKTQTRRVVKDVPAWCRDWGYTAFTPKGSISARGPFEDNFGEKFFRLRYGAPGDRLWVRETWREREPDQDCYSLEFRADRPEYKTRDNDPCSVPWRPSIHMPRTCSRITLEVTGVRVERLQEIQFNEADALAEGAERARISEHAEFSACEDYKQIWTEINGADSWAANPWVWVVEFKRLTATK